jgi:uncharacterized protein
MPGRVLFAAPPHNTSPPMSNNHSQISEVRAEPAQRAWQRMLSGRRLDLLNPSPADIEIDDIAHGLARVARWNGQTTGAHALSVAQHVLMVEDITRALSPDMPPAWRMAALLHDAPEYVIGDLISPFKAAVGFNYKAFELKLLAAIHARFGIAFPLPDEVSDRIKAADRMAAFFEATVLAGFERREAVEFFGQPEALPKPLHESLLQLTPWPAERSQSAFKQRFVELIAAL